MYTKINTNPDIYLLYIPLPKNPLKSLNCYVVKTKDKNLIIDTGFNMRECYEALTSGLMELEVDMNKTDVFLTHLHADHTGLVSSITKEDSVIYMSKLDYEYIKHVLDEEYWNISDEGFLMEGFSEKELEWVGILNPSKVFNTNKMYDAVIVEDNTKFNIGEYEFTCIATPGHTPGHMCLYMEKEKILFLGDHILFDISPNITRWNWAKNSLADYLNSLEKIKKYEIKLALPSHRNNEMDVYERIDQLIHHHKIRLKDTIDTVTANPGLNAYDIAGIMKWDTKSRSWDEFPVQQKWFAVGETLAHLDYLEIEGKVYKEFKNGIYYYYVK